MHPVALEDNWCCRKKSDWDVFHFSSQAKQFFYSVMDVFTLCCPIEYYAILSKDFALWYIFLSKALGSTDEPFLFFFNPFAF